MGPIHTQAVGGTANASNTGQEPTRNSRTSSTYTGPIRVQDRGINWQVNIPRTESEFNCESPMVLYSVYIFSDGKAGGPNNRQHCGVFVATMPDCPPGFVTGILIDAINKNLGSSHALVGRWKDQHITDPQTRLKQKIGNITEYNLRAFKKISWPNLRAPDGVTLETSTGRIADCQTFTNQICQAMVPFLI